MQNIKEIVKDPEWQKTRQQLIGQWNVRPEWCLQQLRNYMGPISSTPEYKLKIILNYLTGTGFRTKAIKEYDKIQRLRAEISAEMKRRKFSK